MTLWRRNHPLLQAGGPNDPLLGGDEERSAPPGGAPRRASSVTLRQEATAQAQSTMLDPANQSLADALNILLYVIYVGVAVLALVYALSGLRTVKEGERGLRVLFGKVTASDLPPGLQWGPPYPLGEIRTISQGVQTVELNSEFWAYFPPDSLNRTLENATPEQSLDPSRGLTSGSIITGDGNIVHAQWSARYRRSDVRAFARTVLDDQEERLVRTAIKRGVVRACAEVPIDMVLMERQEEGVQPLGTRVREIAQRVLTDEMGVGIEIEALTLTAKTPPIALKRDFDKVANADTTRSQAREQALTDRSKQLNETAGEASELVLTQIDEYELLLAKGDDKGAEAKLATIFATLRGDGTDASGRPVRVAGSVTKTISDAIAYRTQAVSERQGALAAFRAKEAQFKASPNVMIGQEWNSAMAALLEKTGVSTVMVPPGKLGDVFQLMVNQNPRQLRELEKRLNEADALRAQQKQAEDQRRRGAETSVEAPIEQ
jgi:regulator of protease activity HflC (stomatin/prohibitin superfamily)